MHRRKILIGLGILVVLGTVLGLIIGLTSKSSSTSTTKESSKPVEIKKKAASKEPMSDPEQVPAVMNFLAIGDWGATIEKPGSCCDKYRNNSKDSEEYKIDYNAQVNVADMLAASAGQLQPKAIISHGDNFYWNGAGSADIDSRMQTTFERVYSQPSLKGIPWLNVLGNHDLGGAGFICGEGDGRWRECKDATDLLKHLDLRFQLQQKYKSPQNRWVLRDHYYKETFTQGTVTIEIYNLDTNYADSHGASQICCQCYGYSKGDKSVKCNSIQPGNKYCAGGDINLYNKCMDKLTGWTEESLKGFENDLKTSKATWKIVNSHYSPHFHMGVDKMKIWYGLCSKYGVHLWLNGHTHGFNHEIANWGTHFAENGGGGGIQAESSGPRPEAAAEYVNTEWVAPGNPYGFYELIVSNEWLKLRFATFDKKWKFSTKPTETVKGGTDYKHCWHIPQTVGKGRPCA